ncbi:MAG TPA: four-carbon acid sugar kinase family protein [Solirubrobacter sp.]|nr:four-carbon acid sugar kinase family protein [Solirubrobacter sp.]
MLVLADDLSGAVEVAAVLGVPRVTLEARDAAGAVVDLDSRALEADEAARRVREVVAAHDGRLVFKKIDSLLRGHVAAEVAALAAGGHVLVTPALPVEGRTVRGGVLHVRGVPQPAVRGVELRDAETDADLDALVAEALARPNARLAGSAGLAAALGRRLGAAPLPPPEPSGAPLLVAIGTAAAEEQIERLAAAGVPVIALEEAEQEPAALAAALGAAPAAAAGEAGAGAGEAAPAAAAGEAAPHGARRAAAGAGAAAPAAAPREAAHGARRAPAMLGAAAPGAGLCEAGVGRRRVIAVRIPGPVEPALGGALVRRLAAVVAGAPRVDLVLTGGETARRALEALGVRELRPVAQVHHGAVQCVTPDGRRVTTRPGSFGGPYGLVQIVESV